MKKNKSNSTSEIFDINREIQAILNRIYRKRAINLDIKKLEEIYRRKAGWRKKLYIDFLSIEKNVKFLKDKCNKREIPKCWKAIRKLDEKINSNSSNKINYSLMLKLHIDLIISYGFEIKNKYIRRTTKNPNLILCEFCQTPLKEKNLQRHLIKKCPNRNINLSDKNKSKKYKTPIDQLKEISSSKKIEFEETTSIKEIEVDVKSTDSLQNTKLNNNKTCSNEAVNEEKIKPKLKLKEQILKHKSEIEQYDEEINDELLTNEEQYYDDIRKKIEYEIRDYKEVDRKKILKQYVYTTKSSAIDTTLRNEIRSYLYKIYRGYCQICGFTFRKPSDDENSFEMHNWDNKLIVKSKRYLVSSADSLCLCRNCSANIKFGAFNPLFVDKIHNLKSKSIDEVKEIICNKVSKEDIVDRFQEFYEWDDIYALEISLNDKPKNIYMTNGHLIQFIAYLQLEERK